MFLSLQALQILCPEHRIFLPRQKRQLLRKFDTAGVGSDVDIVRVDFALKSKGLNLNIPRANRRSGCRGMITVSREVTKLTCFGFA